MRWAYGWAAAAAAVMLVSGCEKASTTARRRTDDMGASGSTYASRDTGGGDRGGDAGGGYAGRGDGGSGGDRAAGGYASGGGDGGYGERRERAATPLFKGEPLWSDNRKYSAQENATYHCGKDGADIGASGYDDCLTKVHAFIDHPPSDVESLTRANGDRLMYDPKANLFVVARKDGAPRTFFKPRTGASYWAEQKQREADRGGGYGHGAAHGADEGAGSGA